ncbi:cationic amino acid transporter 2 [Penaeus vannamei]|uniref:cationic amino acid transporter 2 n=1 Tax=Penaeus vannamei TaxID=6689 RepID=UPI00387F4454
MTPPLLHSRRPHCVSASVRHVYTALSRTRPFAASSRRTQSTPTPPTHGIWGDCGRGLAMLVYRSIGLWAAVGVPYIVGIVAGPIAGPAVTSSLLVAAVTSLLTGFCFAELVTWNGQSSGHLYTVTYQLVGEFVAYLLGVLNTLFAAATLAAVSKALSGTMDYMTGRKVEAFVGRVAGRLPWSQAVPDVIAAGASLSVAVLLALGLEQSGFLRASMGVTSVLALLFFIVVGGSHTEQNTAHLHHAISSELLAGAAVCMVLYSSFYETGRLVKQQRRPQRALPIALSVNTGLAFLAFFALGIVLTLMTGNVIPPQGAPLLQALERRDVGWARLVMGCFQVVMLCLALVEAADPLCRQLVALAADGLFPTSLSHQCSRTSSHAHAHLTGGTLAALMGLLFSHVLLLQVMATCTLCLHVVVVLVVMYRRHRCSYGTLCSVAATASSCSPYSYHRLAPPRHSRQERTLHFLKDGLRVLPQRVLPARPKASPLTSPGSESGVSGLSHDARDTAPLLDNLETSPTSPLKAPLAAPSPPTALQTASECPELEAATPREPPQSADSESESAASGYETDTDAEDDIDAAVAEYQEKLRVATLDTGAPCTPNPASARRACLVLAALLLTVIIESLVAVYGWRGGGTHPFLVATLVICMLVTLLLVVLLTRLPTLRPNQTVAFQVPAAPWLPAAALFLNFFLLVQVLSHSWAVLFVYLLAGISWYFIYGMRHSALATQEVVTQRVRANEFICLEPLAPPALTSTLLQASSERLPDPAHHQSFTRLTPVDTVLITR